MTSVAEKLGKDFPIADAIKQFDKSNEMRDKAVAFMRDLDEACMVIAKEHGLNAGAEESHFKALEKVAEKHITNMKEGVNLVVGLRSLAVMAQEASRTALTLTLKMMAEEGKSPEDLLREQAGA